MKYKLQKKKEEPEIKKKKTKEDKKLDKRCMRRSKIHSDN